MYPNLIINSPKQHPMLSSHKNELIDLRWKSIDWFPYMMTTVEVIKMFIFKNT